MRTEVFDQIVNLRLLKLDNVKLEGNLGKLPSSLKWLQWKRCTLSSYYSNYYPSELAILDLSESQIERIGSWKWTWSRKKVWFTRHADETIVFAFFNSYAFSIFHIYNKLMSRTC